MWFRMLCVELLRRRRGMTEAAMCTVCAAVNIVRPRLERGRWRHEIDASRRRAVSRSILERPLSRLGLRRKPRLRMVVMVLWWWWLLLLPHEARSIIMKGMRSASGCAAVDSQTAGVVLIPLRVGGREHAMGIVGKRVLAERGSIRALHGCGIQYGRIQHSRVVVDKSSRVWVVRVCVEFHLVGEASGEAV